MSPGARQQYLQQMRDRYAVAGRAARSALLDEAVAMTGYHRKALIRRFTRPLGPRRRRRGTSSPDDQDATRYSSAATADLD